MKSLQDFCNILYEEYGKLSVVESYLNERGSGVLEAVKVMLYYSGFANTLEELFESDDMKKLTAIENKPPSYYMYIRQARKAYENYLKIKEGNY